MYITVSRKFIFYSYYFQVSEDGRIPIAVKIILRKFDSQKKTSHRETKQANILPSLFKSTQCNANGAKVVLADGAQDKLLKIIMRLFERVIDMSKPFNITLIGLAFSKFQQRKVGSSSIANFLIKKTDLEVQSVTSLTSEGISESSSCSSQVKIAAQSNDENSFRSSPTTFQPSDQFYRRRTTAASPIPMLVDNGSESAATNSDFSDFSETEVEPSPKKSRIGRLLMAKRRCLGSSVVGTETSDVSSPSKLRVCDLRLNSRDSEKDFPMSPSTSGNTSTNNSTAACIQTRFRTIQTPSTLVSRMDATTTSRRNGTLLSNTIAMNFERQLSAGSTTSLISPMDDSPNSIPSSASTPSTENTLEIESSKSINFMNTETDSTPTAITGNLSNITCPAGVDPNVFNELPLDVQNELISSWRNSLAAAAAAVANGSANSSPGSNSSTTTSSGATQKNTLYRYFLRNK